MSVTEVPATVEVRVIGSALRVRIAGELDISCADLVDDLFDVGSDGLDTVVLDLGALTFCDVTGANALTGLRDFHRAHDRAVLFDGVLPPVRRVLVLLEDMQRRPPVEVPPG